MRNRSLSAILAGLLISLGACSEQPLPPASASDSPATIAQALEYKTQTIKSKPPLPNNPAKNTMLIMGDSLSAGYGIDITDAWVSLLQNRLILANYDYQVVNASISGETSAGGLRRLPKALAQWQPTIVVIELGGNDGLRGTPLATMRDNLAGMISLSQTSDAKVLLLGMQIPPNYGPRYSKAFFQSYNSLASDYKIPLLPFLLEGIATNPELMQQDGIHPKADAQTQMLDAVWTLLEPML